MRARRRLAEQLVGQGVDLVREMANVLAGPATAALKERAELFLAFAVDALPRPTEPRLVPEGRRSVVLDGDQRCQVAAMVSEGDDVIQRRARVILGLADGVPPIKIAAQFEMSVHTVDGIRRRFAEDGAVSLTRSRGRPKGWKKAKP